jgi:hypothetical protein
LYILVMRKVRRHIGQGRHSSATEIHHDIDIATIELIKKHLKPI